MGFMEDLHNTDPEDYEGFRKMNERWKELDSATRTAIIDQTEMRLQGNARRLIRVWSQAVMDMPEQPTFIVGVNSLEAIEEGNLAQFENAEQFLMVAISAIVLLLREKLGVSQPDLESLLDE